jgi:hypothetical protein
MKSRRLFPALVSTVDIVTTVSALHTNTAHGPGAVGQVSSISASGLLGDVLGSRTVFTRFP